MGVNAHRDDSGIFATACKRQQYLSKPTKQNKNNE